MNKKDKIEIINIDLSINIEEEIKNKIDSLSNNITLYTEDLIKRSIKKVSKKVLAKQKVDEDLQKAIDILIEKSKEQSFWIKGWELARDSGIEPTPQNVNKLSMRIKKKFKEDGKWLLVKSRKKGKVCYRVERISSQ